MAAIPKGMFTIPSTTRYQPSVVAIQKGILTIPTTRYQPSVAAIQKGIFTIAIQPDTSPVWRLFQKVSLQ